MRKIRGCKYFLCSWLCRDRRDRFPEVFYWDTVVFFLFGLLTGARVVSSTNKKDGRMISYPYITRRAERTS